jgi:tripartite-type tricarboxylate transporter receptor subunit TctC
MIVDRRQALKVLGALSTLPSWNAFAQSYPGKPVRIVVPFTPGGSNDVLGRVLAQKLAEMWGQTVVVDNKPGASGNIGADAVAKSAPDGLSLLIAANNILSMNSALFSKMPFNPTKDLESISLLGWVPVVLVMRSSRNIGSISELIDAARKNPGGLTYASAGLGSPQHLSAELFRTLTKVNMVHVPYKGAAPAITDMLSGQVDLMFGAINSLLPHIRSGKLKAIGVAGAKRLTSMPDVPTVAEFVPGFESDIWIGLSAAAGIPADVRDKINRDVKAVLAMPDVKEKLLEQGIEPAPSSPAEMTKLVTSDLARWTQVVRDAGIKPE